MNKQIIWINERKNQKKLCKKTETNFRKIKIYKMKMYNNTKKQGKIDNCTDIKTYKIYKMMDLTKKILEIHVNVLYIEVKKTIK